MIKSISLENFKCYQERVTFPTAKINILYGMNGRGKSTILQALLLFNQTLLDKNTISKLQLKGRILNIGTFYDVINRYSNTDSFGIEIMDDQERVSVAYGIDENLTMATLTSLFVNDKNYFDEHSTFSESVEDSDDKNSKRTLGVIDKSTIRLLNTLEHVIYVSADRIGPKEFVERKPIEKNDIGVQGENSYQVIESQGADFASRVQAELDFILGGASVRVSSSEDKSIIQLYLDSVNGTDGYKPINVGFGYSYVLPVVLSVLLAEKGSVVILENPEAHLHPAAQSRIVSFILRHAIEKDLQIFVETHSDHVVNGIRIAVKKGEIDHGDVSILHFERDAKEKLAPGFEQIKVDRQGNLSIYPEDFMDEWTKQLLELA